MHTSQYENELSSAKTWHGKILDPMHKPINLRDI